MDTEFIATIKGKKLLYCVLNWGLGHASRSIPLIKQLADRNVVAMAADGEAGLLLKQELPDLIYHELPSYGIHYKYSSMHLNMLLQFPKIATTYLQENKAIGHLVNEEGYNFIISDNRYGCFHKSVKSIFIGHQLNILGSQIATKINKHQISNFDECWIPDDEDRRLSGDLSNTGGLDSYKFIGPLSRMQSLDLKVQYDIAIVLSGPEPKRTHLENILVTEALKLQKKICLVRGTKNAKRIDQAGGQSRMEVIDFLDSERLNKIISSSRMIICRSGYSSLMDLEVVGKPSLIIPTKGQKEQEYLAEHYAKRKNVIAQTLDQIDIASAFATLCS